MEGPGQRGLGKRILGKEDRLAQLEQTGWKPTPPAEQLGLPILLQPAKGKASGLEICAPLTGPDDWV